MHPPVCNEPKRTAGWNVVAEIDFDVMIARNALILTATKRVEIVSVESVYEAGDVLPPVVNSSRNLAWRGDSRYLQLSRRNHKTFVNKNVRVLRMINDDQTQVVVVIGFP